MAAVREEIVGVMFSTGFGLSALTGGYAYLTAMRSGAF